jgi:hypothetical protein
LDVAHRGESAKRIDELTKDWVHNSIELGLEFKKVRDTFPLGKDDASGGRITTHAKRPGWHDWIKKNSVWSRHHVNSFIRIAEKFDGKKLPPKVSHKVLIYLSRPDTSMNSIPRLSS